MSGSNLSNPAAPPAPVVNDPVAMTVHSLPDPAAVQPSQKRTGRWRMLLVLAICAAPVVASYFSFYVLKLSGSAYGDLITPTVDFPADLSLRNLAGQPVSAESLKGQWLLTLVQDGACDAACEKKLFTQRQLREMLGKERDKVEKLWLVPDDVALRPDLQQAVTTGVPVTVLRAPRAQLEAFLKAAPGQRLSDHFFIIDPMGRWMLRSPPDADPGKLKNDLNRLLKANAGWDKPGR